MATKVESRTCPRCGIHKPAAGFYVSKHTGYGLTPYCQDCIRAQTNARLDSMSIEQKRAMWERRRVQIEQRRAADPEFDLAWRQTSRARTAKFVASRPGTAPSKRSDPDAHAAYMREWRTGHADRAREISREAGKRHRRRDPERARIGNAINNANRRAIVGGMAGRLVYADWLAILKRMSHRCAFCLASDCLLDLEHVDPLVKGGSNEPSNITCACRPCNGQKNARTLAEFCALRGLDESEIRARVASGVAPASPTP